MPAPPEIQDEPEQPVSQQQPGDHPELFLHGVEIVEISHNQKCQAQKNDDGAGGDIEPPADPSPFFFYIVYHGKYRYVISVIFYHGNTEIWDNNYEEDLFLYFQ